MKRCVTLRKTIFKFQGLQQENTAARSMEGPEEHTAVGTTWWVESMAGGPTDT